MSGWWRRLLSVKLVNDNLSCPRVFWVVVIAVFSGWLVGRSPQFLEYQERGVYDILQPRYRSFDPQYPLILIATGNRSSRALQQLSQPRFLHAQILDRLNQAHFVVLGVPLTEASMSGENASTTEEANVSDDEEGEREGKDGPAGEDALLVEAIRRHGRVGGSVFLTSSPQGDIVQEPLPVFYDAFKRVGIANLEEDADGVYRRGVWGAEVAGKFFPSLSTVALEELCERSFPITERNRRTEVRLPWKSMNLHRSSRGFIEFWLNWTRDEIPVYEYIDVLNGKVADSAFRDALVIIDDPSRIVVTSTRQTISEGEYILRSVASLLSPFALRRINGTGNSILTMILVACGAVLGFVHFKRSFIFLLLLFVSYASGAVILFFKEGLWLPMVGPFLTTFCGYLGSQAILSWYLYNEWDVRSLSIKPLLALAQRADMDLDMGMNFDEYLRSLWNDIEKKTGVILKSTRINENFSLVQNYLLRAQSASQQGQENFYIIKNASDSLPRHRMLLPLPLWKDHNNKMPTREYVILAWNGNIPVETLTSLAALTLFAAVHFHALEESRRRKEMLFKTIEAIMMAVEAKDPTTSDHSRRVANLSKQLAQWMNLTPQEIEDIYFSAIIHDIGKLGISDSILKKPAMLTQEEISEMQRHPSIGEDIMRPVDLPEYITSGITQHHERHDGKGYPSGIKGDRMTTAGKIIKVADVFDALANRRQYKEAWTPQQVRNFLLERRGTEFDPQIVDVFLRHL
jgi:HD-GYP domain-containing protein (c-di-GMP phosphodiesterase class II)/CHASE2 domain-containing sensor protein